MTQLLEAPATKEVSVAIDFDELLRLTRPVKPKLSEAIRRGSQQTMPDRFNWIRGNPEIGVSACAIGAACYAVTEWSDLIVDNLSQAAAYFPELLIRTHITAEHAPELYAYAAQESSEAAQEYAEADWTLGEYIIVLNDSVKLSRQRIADIVEALGY